MARETGWKETQAEVTGCRISWFYSQYDSYSGQSAYVVRFRYRAAGRLYTGSTVLSYPLENGEDFPISYNPMDPSRNSAAQQLMAERRGGLPPAALSVVRVGGYLAIRYLFF